MSKFSHLIETDDPVRILEGKYLGRVGQVIDIIFHGTKLVVDVSGHEVMYDRNQLEPLFDLEQGIKLVYENDTTPALVKKVIPFGMSSDDLAEEVAEFIVECTSRIKGVGKDQYEDGGHQKFEEMDLDDLFEYAEEELRDVANYAAFLVIRLRRIRAALDAADDLGDGTEEEYAAGDITADDFKEGNEGSHA